MKIEFIDLFALSSFALKFSILIGRVKLPSIVMLQASSFFIYLHG